MNNEILKENRIHGDIMFPLDCYHMDFDRNSNILDCHWHEEMEFFIATDGDAVMHIGGKQYSINKGEALFIQSGEIHSGYSLNNPLSFNAIVFHISILNSNPYDSIQSKYINAIQNKQERLPVSIQGRKAWEKTLICHLESIIRLSEEKEYTYEMQIKAYLYQIFSIMLRNCNVENEEAPSYKTLNLKRVIKYIQEHYSDPITIQELAGLINMSEGHFCRIFKQMVLKTPIEYINYYRVMKASILLQNTDRKILDIALDVGFRNFSYFISRFKQYMKCTPSKFRNKH